MTGRAKSPEGEVEFKPAAKLEDAVQDESEFPSWRYGPNGEAQIFACAADVPKGWADHPSAHDK